ncbi:MAG TPA: hypothetical protein VGI51_02285 [Steroidobacteraceae bacterium]
MAAGLLSTTRTAVALPSFARQTGLPCARCHTVAYGPALTAYGRQFKLNGYVWGDAKEVIPPIAAMVQGGFTRTAKAQTEPPADHFATNDNLSVDQVSLFYGGRITQHIGAFVQVTYSGEDRKTTWDNLDVRYAHATSIGDKSVVFGVSVNNNPTVQDLWNSTPGWGFPYITSGLAPSPTAAPMIAGGLGQLVLGATAYAMVDDHLYLEAGAYRGLSDRWLSNVGLTADDNPHVNGLAPYWRAAWQVDKKQNYFSVGVFGLDTKLQPDASVPLEDRFNDIGVDATYQYTDGGRNGLSANLSLIHEKQTLDASFGSGSSASNSNHLNSLELDVTYAYNQTWVASVGLFNSNGSRDAGLYAPAPDSGSNNGSPNSRGYVLGLEYVPFGKLDSFASPWLNLRIGLQYTGYERYNGGTSNYDGFGRSAGDNNTLFAFLWLAI